MLLNPAAPTTSTPGLTSGRWAVRAAGSRLLLETKACGFVGVQGRFTSVAGHVDVAADPQASSIRISVATASLTSGNARRDALLDAAGLIDPEAGPYLRFRSVALRCFPSGWEVDGLLGTARGALPLRLALAEPVATEHGVRLRASGTIARSTIDALIARPGAARLLGPSATLDLTVELTSPS
ncbi:YceI family protein [Pseudonocardia sp. TRM90224]|uniref:YceI family protein n=1 Tax=Pseudonocardia sp. TRM90224 TaxID=2812678 RepID=UPI001E2A01F2|nr:YceI family protein [Pseudonocardia sp. TRM90224]